MTAGLPSLPPCRLPWTTPKRPEAPALTADQRLVLSVGDALGHAVAIAHGLSAEAAKPTMLRWDRARDELRGEPPGPSARAPAGPTAAASRAAEVMPRSALPADVILPALLEGEANVVCDDPFALAEALCPDLFRPGRSDPAQRQAIHAELLDAAHRLAHPESQAAYEAAHADLAGAVHRVDQRLSRTRYLSGPAVAFEDVLLFTFAVRLDAVYFGLFKATVGLLADFPNLEAHARDLFEHPAFWDTTDFEAIKAQHYLTEPELHPKRIVPIGGVPDLDAPHDRRERFEAAREDEAGAGPDAAAEEDPTKDRGRGEWVRPRSELRSWIRPGGPFPPEAGRYHLYAPYNCPWSHRALLGRAVKGLDQVIDASIVYFRRDPNRGWQFNPAIPGCTEDRVHGYRYVTELYESVGSRERSVPVLWDTRTEQVVSNESADILRMLGEAFGALAARTIDLYPAQHRAEIDRINAVVYQRINNGAYKAGFARSQAAYERAAARYFRALDWVEDRLRGVDWLAGSAEATEADLRLFPTVFRHDAVYYARFGLNRKRIRDYPRLRQWLDRMLAVPGVREASDLDHARNGYFGRTGNGIVPAGPVPLGLSPKDFSPAAWRPEEA
jgi:putative glutathione S-transferase